MCIQIGIFATILVVILWCSGQTVQLSLNDMIIGLNLFWQGTETKAVYIGIEAWFVKL